MRPATALLVVPLFVAASFGAAADAPMIRGELGHKLDEYLGRLATLGYSGGLLVTVKGEVVIEKGFGFADREKQTPMATDSVFNIGSITKQFTAAAILQLEAAGKLSVTDPITRYFDAVPPDKTAITLHQLLTHSSGLESDFANDYDPNTREEYVAHALTSKLLWPPGTRYEYSNAGYSLLAAIVEKLSGQDYESYLRARVFVPAGMRETGYAAPAWSAERLAVGYENGERWGTILERLAPPGSPFWALRGNGGLHTTLGDMLRWHQALATDRVLPAAARAKYFKPYVPEDPEGTSHYAYGWAVSRTPRGTTVVQHNGGNGVHIAEFQRFVDEDVVVFLTSTVAEMSASSAVETVDRIVFGEPYALPPRLVAVAADVQRARVGRYRLANGGELIVEMKHGELQLRGRGGRAVALVGGAAASAQDSLDAASRRTEAIAGRAFAGDFRPLQEAFKDSARAQEVRAREEERMRERVASLGAYRGFSVLGTAPWSDGILVASVQVDFEKGAAFNHYFWEGDTLRGIRASNTPPGVRLVPVSPTDCETFSLTPPWPAVGVMFEGRAMRVRPAGGAADVVAHRVE